jgi:tRNA-splicing ligase RtcB (3'-phosphate/5'-hydroxy nucleic acid ligase)
MLQWVPKAQLPNTFVPVRSIIEGGRIPVKVFTDDLEPHARAQLLNVAQLPIVFGHVAAMPDVHAGIGATVGSVIPTRRAIIPAAVGVDIGCGMNAVRLSLEADRLPDGLSRVRAAIERAVPVGFDEHRESDSRRGACAPLARRLETIVRKHPKIAKMQRDHENKWVRQMGSLGGGNHFIEVCLDESGRVWVMLHSGSRGAGNCIGRYFIAQAREAMHKRDAHLPDRDLAWLEEGSMDFEDYVEAVGWAQDYALANRHEMMELILNALRRELPEFDTTDEAINCHHNYVQEERHAGERVYVTRKGAISAREGELGIIPGSMGARSYIVRGKGNPESFCSCAHGAGRRMSRAEAKRRFSRADLEEQTRGVECRKDKGVLDEIPGAYKDIDRVMADQTDLVEIVHTLKQVVCVKG